MMHEWEVCCVSVLGKDKQVLCQVKARSLGTKAGAMQGETQSGIKV